jgi:alpha-galactosidase/6-phospho-beta-glucosidase family protein
MDGASAADRLCRPYLRSIAVSTSVWADILNAVNPFTGMANATKRPEPDIKAVVVEEVENGAMKQLAKERMVEKGKSRVVGERAKMGKPQSETEEERRESRREETRVDVTLVGEGDGGEKSVEG